MRSIIRPDLLLVFFLLLSAFSVQAEIDSARRTELIALLKQDCGSCHGMTLKGGLGPALTPAALRGKSPQMLVDTILRGRPGTPMPPWSKFLQPEEVRWLVDRLYRGIEDDE